MRIILFYPRGSTYSGGAHSVNHLACVMPPIGLASLAAVLRADGHDVRILDAALLRSVPNEQWAADIVSARPDYLGFSAITSGFNDGYDVCERVKSAAPGIRTVFGGVHASWGKGDLLRQFPAIDFIIAGEGEYSLRKLVAGHVPQSVPGLYFRSGLSVQSGPPHEALCEMDSLPFPAYDLLPGFPQRYLMPLFGYPARPGAGIISSRGCVHGCSYCDRSVFGASFRWNSPEYTAEQIRWLSRDFGVRHIYFYDDQFAANRSRVERLCELLVKKRMNLSFNCIVRIGSIDRRLCELLKAAGCWMANVGIESGDQRMLDRYKSGLTLDAVRRDVALLTEHGIHAKGLFMMGLPGETPESIAATRKFALSLPLKDANVTAFTPFPGAPLSSRVTEAGEMRDEWPRMDCEQFVFVPRGISSRAFLERERALFIRSFYQRPFMRGVYLKMLFESPHSYWRLLKNFKVFLEYFLKINKRGTNSPSR
jgi:anaerobic magnesium-protoporphyrin IX monomethyl ester cyclase